MQIKTNKHMRLLQLSIRNFRGIKAFEWTLPKTNLCCLIGSGDSTKSTILEAIRYVFYPDWRPSFNDSDFFNCDTSTNIEIVVTVGNLMDHFIDKKRYGDHLRGWNFETLQIVDEPGDKLEEVLTIRFTVSQDLEPDWKVINDRNGEGVEFRTRDRRRIQAGFIGVSSDRHLSWGRGSILTRLTDGEANTTPSLAKAARSARGALNEDRGGLVDLDETAASVSKIARSFGVPVTQEYRANLDFGLVNLSAGGLALHDGEVPLRQLGMGSKRMLTSGLQKEAIEDSHITLIDEIEVGLEPFRISRLLKHLNADESGQYFITTHSPVVLRELSVENLFAVTTKNGDVSINAFGGKGTNTQGTLRRGAEAFLARKIIVCEGATEIGLCRGLDNYWITTVEKNSFSFEGVATYSANGASEIVKCAKDLKSLGYDVSVVADSDAKDKFGEEHSSELEKEGVSVFCWDWASEFSTEQAILSVLPWHYVISSLAFLDEEGRFTKDSISNSGGLASNISEWDETPELRVAIGLAAKNAKKKNWFKRIDIAEQWVEVIQGVFGHKEILESDFWKKIQGLRTWIEA